MLSTSIGEIVFSDRSESVKTHFLDPPSIEKLHFAALRVDLCSNVFIATQQGVQDTIKQMSP